MLAMSVSIMTSLLLLHLVAGSCQGPSCANLTSEHLIHGYALQEWINVCYFTNWARYRNGLINKGKDVFEMGLDAELCTHFMYGFAKVARNDASGGYEILSLTPMLTTQVGTPSSVDSVP